VAADDSKNGAEDCGERAGERSPLNSRVAVILPQPKKAPSQWIEKLSMSALAISRQFKAKMVFEFADKPDLMPGDDNEFNPYRDR
jgi:hypothetical protein